MSATFREILLVTMASRAAYMDCQELIDIPGGTSGEDELAEFVVKTVDDYLIALDNDDPNFDELIETALVAEYGGDKQWADD